jgi:hypothetical protein
VKTKLTATGVLRDAAGRVAGILARTADGEHLRPRCVVGADDLCSPVAGWVGAATLDSFATEMAIFYCYVGDVPRARLRLSHSGVAFAGVFLTHGGEASVWRCRPTPALDSLRRGPEPTAPPHRSSSSTPSPPTSPPGSARPPHHVRHTP